MSKTSENLKTAFAGESQANHKYLAFAKKADEDGYPQIAKLFRAAAHAETIHAHNHLKALGGILSTAENLQAGVEGENYEVLSMYPPMIAEAEAEEDKRAARSFKWAIQVEKVHEELYRQAAEALAGGETSAETDYYVCPVCGYTHEGPLNDKCPVCGMAGEKFEKIA
ncbi:MAG: rubrerythrin family protein [Anaerolineales bacterium]|nr:rubrerythrin family protein [Anaerolineales bacterium]